MKKLIIAFFMMVLVGCGSLPTHENIREDKSPQISIVNAPVGTVVYIDGQETAIKQGDRSKKFYIKISSGKHLVEIFIGGQKVKSQTIFTQGDSVREITL